MRLTISSRPLTCRSIEMFLFKFLLTQLARYSNYMRIIAPRRTALALPFRSEATIVKSCRMNTNWMIRIIITYDEFVYAGGNKLGSFTERLIEKYKTEQPFNYVNVVGPRDRIRNRFLYPGFTRYAEEQYWQCAYMIGA